MIEKVWHVRDLSFVQFSLSINSKMVFKPGMSTYDFSRRVVQVKKTTKKSTGLTGQALNPCESSFSLNEVVVHTFCQPGSRMLVLCSGLGTMEEVCIANGVNVTAVEKNKQMAQAARQRLEGLPNVYKQAFLRPWKVPSCDLVPVALCPSLDKSLPENTKGFTILPYKPSGAPFCVSSSAAFSDIFVSFVYTTGCDSQ